MSITAAHGSQAMSALERPIGQVVLTPAHNPCNQAVPSVSVSRRELSDPAQLDDRPHDLDIDGNGSIAAKNAGEHRHCPAP
jgi:hypothetical protein